MSQRLSRTNSNTRSSIDDDVIIDDFNDAGDLHIGDFMPIDRDSNHSHDDLDCLNKSILLLRNCCFLLIQISILILIGIQLYVTIRDPNYNFVLSTLSTSDNEKTCNSLEEPIIQDNLIDLKKYIDELESQIAHIKSYLNETKIWKNNIEQQLQVVSSPPEENVDDKIQKALMRYDADKVGVVDYALKSGGGSILSTPDTYPYAKPIEFNIIGFLWFNSYSDRNLLIQPNNLPGDCFAFDGSNGKIRIQLAKKILVTSFTIEHVNPNLVDDISSAPKEIEVYVSKDENFENVQKLASYVYDINKGPVQTFPVDKPENIPYEYVELNVLSNYGNKDYTCVYRFRVHGNKHDS